MQQFFWTLLGDQVSFKRKIMIISQKLFSKKIYSGGGSRSSKWLYFETFNKSSQSLLRLRVVSKLKNHHQLTFGILKSDWDVVWCSRLVLRIDMILRKLTNTYFVYWTPTENFLMTLKVKYHIHKKVIFLVCKRFLLFLPLKVVSKLKNHHQVTFKILKTDWDVVRCFRLFLRIDMTLSKLTNTYFVH